MPSVAFKKLEPAINSRSKILLLLLGACLFNLLFWQEKIGINSIAFFLFILASLVFFHPKAFGLKMVWFLMLCTVFCLAMVLLQNTLLSKLAFCCSLCLLAAYCQYIHRSILFAGASLLQSYLLFIPNFFSSISRLFTSTKNKKKSGKTFRLALLPIAITIIFFVFYLMANKVFASLTERFADQFSIAFQHVLNWIKPERILFILLGLFICGGLLVRYIKAPSEKAEKLLTDNLFRKRETKYSNAFQRGWAGMFMGKMASGPLALKYELKTGILCLLLLNILLLFVNGTDVMYVWFNMVYKPNMDWPKFVHDGAELLVFSILLAMGIVLFFFRGNINFLKTNKKLKGLAYIWLFQNGILAISVCIRNGYYIANMGLAYKRVGLYVYVLLVIIGLFSIVFKILNKKSSYFLWRVNAMAAFIILVVASAVDWDFEIVKYNLSKKESINTDIGFLLQLNDHVIPLLKQNKDWICAIANKAALSDSSSNNDVFIYNRMPPKCAQITEKENSFLQNLKQHTWLSWNYADKKTQQDLLKIK